MADIYVRSYDSGGGKKHKGLVTVVLIVIFAGALGWWLVGRHSQKKGTDAPVRVVESLGVAAPVTSAPQKSSIPAASSSPAKPAASAGSSASALTPQDSPSLPAPLAQPDMDALFSRAQSLVSSGKRLDASRVLEDVISRTTDESLRNNALRIQGRVNIDLFLSDAPSPWKKNYVIQPGDSLDRIARRNHTTVDLIRRINKIDGNLIFPGARLQLPAAPFVVQVQKSACTMELVMDGKRFKRYAVGLGRFGKTPLGTFSTVVHQANPDWTPPGGGIVPFGDPRNVLGTRWMSIQDEARPEIKGFGIHGTADRGSIGSEASNGCIRMLNEDVEEVFLLIPRGTQVTINE